MVEWIIEKEPVAYETAVNVMEQRIADIRSGTKDELIWLLEHPSLYTAGTSAKDSDIIDARFPVHKTGRGGEYTYHGAGQRVAYAMLDLKKRQNNKPDVRGYVFSLEEWIIQTLAEFDIKGERRSGRVGIWVADGDGSENKIAAIGVRIRKWVAYHGIAINLNPDLSHFDGIIPCGISDHGVTSIHEVGREISMNDLDIALQKTWKTSFL